MSRRPAARRSDNKLKQPSAERDGVHAEGRDDGLITNLYFSSSYYYCDYIFYLVSVFYSSEAVASLDPQVSGIDDCLQISTIYSVNTARKAFHSILQIKLPVKHSVDL